jgi:hypothetical protein
MSTQIVQNSKLWFDGYNLSGVMNALAINYGADMVEATVLEDDTHIMKGGLKSATMAHEGFFSAGVAEADPILQSNLGVADVPVSIGPVNGGVDGELAYMMRAILGEYSPGASVGEMFAFSVTAESSNEGLIRGTIMHNAARSTSGDGTARQLGALSDTESMFVAVHVVSISGTLDLIVESDAASDMLSATTQITVPTISAVGSAWGSKAGAVTDDWWRVGYTLSGTAEFVVVMGIK